MKPPVSGGLIHLATVSRNLDLVTPGHDNPFAGHGTLWFLILKDIFTASNIPHLSPAFKLFVALHRLSEINPDHSDFPALSRKPGQFVRLNL